MLDTENVNIQQAQDMVQELGSVNLDEAAPPPVSVAFGEIVQKGHGCAFNFVTKEIHTRVPFHFFNRMLQNQKQMQKIRRKQAHQTEYDVSSEQEEQDIEESLDTFLDKDDATLTIPTDEEFRKLLSGMDIAFVWQLKEVLAVWKLTPGEEGMSLKKLYLGLTFDQIEGLFMRFFGARLLKKASKA